MEPNFLNYSIRFGRPRCSPGIWRSHGDHVERATGAALNWIWQPDKIKDQNTHNTWQYRAISELVREHKGIDAPDTNDIGKFFDYDGSFESRIFMFLMRSAIERDSSAFCIACLVLPFSQRLLLRPISA